MFPKVKCIVKFIKFLFSQRLQQRHYIESNLLAHLSGSNWYDQGYNIQQVCTRLISAHFVLLGILGRLGIHD